MVDISTTQPQRVNMLKLDKILNEYYVDLCREAARTSARRVDEGHESEEEKRARLLLSENIKTLERVEEELDVLTESSENTLNLDSLDEERE